MRAFPTAILILCLAATAASGQKKSQRGQTAFLLSDAPGAATRTTIETSPTRNANASSLQQKDVTSGIIDGITFAESRGQVYFPVSDANYYLGHRVRHESSRGLVRINGRAIPESSLRHLIDGTVLISLADVERAGVPVIRHRGGRLFNIGEREDFFTVAVNAKRTEVNLATQRLRAWQGDRLVLQCRVSTGKNRGTTPTGSFRAGPYKSELHLSSLYDNAPMPWSTQIAGHVFIHGYSSVPDYPASHGCIRVPLNEGNPAKFFYEWVDSGSPVRIVNHGSSSGGSSAVMLPPATSASLAERERPRFAPFSRR